MLLWARAAATVHAFVPRTSDASILDFATYLIVGTLVGTFFCAIILVVSVFALPMLHDRGVDAATTAITSIHAVLHNDAAMLAWAVIIMVAITIGFATALLGLAVLLPGLPTQHGRATATPWTHRPGLRAAPGSHSAEYPDCIPRQNLNSDLRTGLVESRCHRKTSLTPVYGVALANAGPVSEHRGFSSSITP